MGTQTLKLVWRYCAILRNGNHADNLEISRYRKFSPIAIFKIFAFSIKRLKRIHNNPNYSHLCFFLFIHQVSKHLKINIYKRSMISNVIKVYIKLIIYFKIPVQVDFGNIFLSIYALYWWNQGYYVYKS